MNEKFSPSQKAPLKSYAHYEDAPRGEWFLISNAKGGLYGYRWHEEGATDMYLTREVIDSRDEWDFNGVTNCELEFLPSLSRFLSGEHGIDGEPKWRDDEDGHPCFWSYKDCPSNSGCRVIGDTGGELKAYRNAHGVYLVDDFKLDYLPHQGLTKLMRAAEHNGQKWRIPGAIKRLDENKPRALRGLPPMAKSSE